MYITIMIIIEIIIVKGRKKKKKKKEKKKRLEIEIENVWKMYLFLSMYGPFTYPSPHLPHSPLPTPCALLYTTFLLSCHIPLVNRHLPSPPSGNLHPWYPW